MYRRPAFDDLEKAITQVDPDIEPEKLDSILFWAFRVRDREQLENTSLLQYADLEQRLINGNISRTQAKL